MASGGHPQVADTTITIHYLPIILLYPNTQKLARKVTVCHVCRHNRNQVEQHHNTLVGPHDSKELQGCTTGPAHFSVRFGWGVVPMHETSGQSGRFGMLLSVQVGRMQQCNSC